MDDAYSSEVIDANKGKMIFIGPEGGFSNREALFCENNMPSVSFNAQFSE